MEDISALRARIQRDINCLCDADKFKRKRGIAALHAFYFEGGATGVPASQLAALFASDLLRPVVLLFGDAAESTREAALTFVEALLGSKLAAESPLVAPAGGGDAAPACIPAALLTAALPVFTARVGHHPYQEEAEELRHLIVRVLNALVVHPSTAAVVAAHASEIAVILQSLCGDAFPAVKIDAAAGAAHLARAAPTRIHLQFGALVAALVGAAGHQRGAVRLAAVEALDVLLPLGAESLPRVLAETLLPALRQSLRFDRVVSVRKATGLLLCHLLSGLPPSALGYSVTVATGLPTTANSASPTAGVPPLGAGAPGLATGALVPGRTGSASAPVPLGSVLVAMLAGMVRDAEAAAEVGDALLPCVVESGNGWDAAATGGSGAASGPVPADLAAAAAAAAGDEEAPALGTMTDDGDEGSGDLSAAASPSMAADAFLAHLDVATLPHPFNHADKLKSVLASGLPPALRRHYLGPALAVALWELQDWTVRVRCFGAAALGALVILSGPRGVAPYVDAVLPALCVGLRDADPEVRKALLDTGRVLGAFVPPALQLAALLPQLRGDALAGAAGGSAPPAAAPATHAATLSVLAAVLSNMQPADIHAHIEALADTLSAPHLAEDEPPSLRANLGVALVCVAKGLAALPVTGEADSAAGAVAAAGDAAQPASARRARRLSCCGDGVAAPLPAAPTPAGAASVDPFVASSPGPHQLGLSQRTFLGLLTAILNVLDANSTDAVATLGLEAATLLRRRLGYVHSAAMYATAAEALLRELASSVRTWNKATPARRTFDAFIRCARAALSGTDEASAARLASLVADVFASTLDPTRAAPPGSAAAATVAAAAGGRPHAGDPELQIAQLALLDELLQGGGGSSGAELAGPGSAALVSSSAAGIAGRPDPTSAALHFLDAPVEAPLSSSDRAARALEAGLGGGTHTVSNTTVDVALVSVAGRLVRDCLLPNAVWRIGLVAATVRKVSVACMLTLARRRLLRVDALLPLLPELLPVIKSCLNDDDGATRHLSTSLSGLLLKELRRCLGGEEVRSLYVELLKRLDDSNDAVRIAGCGALEALAAAGRPEDMAGGPVEHTLDALLVQMDDPSPPVQAAAYNAAVPYLKLDPPYAAKALKEAKEKHRSPALCDKLLALLG